MDRKECLECLDWLYRLRSEIYEFMPKEWIIPMDNALDMAIKALEQEHDAIHNEREQAYMRGYEDASKRYRTEPCGDAISRSDAIRVASGYCHWSNIPQELEKLPSASTEKTGHWIPVSERLPEDLETVNITWVNHNPESYYMDIKDKPFTATGVYFNGQWYWWSTLCTDTLAEYSHNYYDIIDDDIEITAWMPLPQPYTAESE